VCHNLDCLALRLPVDLVADSGKTKALEVPPEFPHSVIVTEGELTEWAY